MENKSRFKNIIIIGLAVLCASGYFSFEYYFKNIIPTMGLFDKPELVLKHNIYDDEPEFGPNSVFIKLDTNNNCIEIPRMEIEEITNKIKLNDLILDAVIGRTNRSGDHWVWYINQNRVIYKDNPEFTRIYFSDNYMCESYLKNKDTIISDYKEVKSDQEKLKEELNGK